MALGKLLSAPTTTTFELADEEFKYALNTLKNDQNLSRFAACCEIKEVAMRIPILFAVYLGEFLSVMWNALRDQKDYIREAGLETFSLALHQMETREELFVKVFTECLKGLSNDSQSATVLGSILVLDVMLEKNTSLLLQHLNVICSHVKKVKDHKASSVRQAVIELVPWLVAFIVNNGRKDELDTCEKMVEHVVKAAVNAGKEAKAEIFIVLGQIAMISAPGFESRIKVVMDLVNSELKKKPLQVAIFEVLKGVTHTLGGRIGEFIDLQSHITTVFPT